MLLLMRISHSLICAIFSTMGMGGGGVGVCLGCQNPQWRDGRLILGQRAVHTAKE